ncbi:MAG: hypothetical protein A2297_06555 [Elusimicrobia bacterium RIFOXYB2_FULL_48_7]|nr:MAG: hypothetical protein A2297_06555 [Elusimicrobia bacterium RIFOXYB2_FULL_48_7]
MINRIKAIPRDYMLFLLAVAFIGFAGGIVNASFNNFLNEKFAISSLQRSALEVPREIPGFLVMFVSAMLFFMCNRTLAAFSQIIAALGIACIGLFSFNFNVMLVWLFIYSTGQHLFLPLMADIGMGLSKDGKPGKTLGRLYGADNLAAILGSFTIFIGFGYLHLTFSLSFIIAAIGFCLAALMIYLMKKNKPVSVKTKFTVRREYGLYYWLTVLYGTRKQLFMTFAPWVLVTIFGLKVQAIATLLTIGGVIGIFFKPALGQAIDRFGEKKILIIEAVLFVFVCIGYGFSRKLFAADIALIVTSACYITDQLLLSVGMARSTYLKKIARNQEELTSTLTLATTLDHVFSISIAVCGGLIWKAFGYEYIFLIGAGIAAANFVSAFWIRIPVQSEQN